MYLFHPSSSSFVQISFILLLFSRGISGATFTVINKCESTVWPGVLANAGSTPLESTGFELPSGGSRTFQGPTSWSGRFWGRTGCTFDPATGQGSCLTGDCGSNQIECGGRGAQPPATLAEFTVGSGAASGGQDFYDVSLVDGYNVPMLVEASSGSGPCLSTGCVTDLNRVCPAELRVASGGACRSACEAFGSEEYCCSGAYGSPDTCKPSMYSEMFKSACPRSYSYAYDDATSTFTCTAADYTITFCPSSSSSSQKSATANASSTPSTMNPSGTYSTTTPSSQTSSSSDGSYQNYPWMPNFSNGGDSSKTLTRHHTWIVISLFTLLFLILFLHS